MDTGSTSQINRVSTWHWDTLAPSIMDTGSIWKLHTGHTEKKGNILSRDHKWISVHYMWLGQCNVLPHSPHPLYNL